MTRARNGRGLAIATAPVRAAIYTRKSTDEGLNRDFNSLDNQRERAEDYVASQDWGLVAERYDDGGFSGGSLERPAFKRMMADVEAGLVDVVVCYRLDRISRSLIDFLNFHEFLERNGVSLVSVTESIDTSSPHGRMMVNVLLSFAQYERELIAERTRHKIHAARRRGKWTGGTPPLGYDTAPEGGRLLVNKTEAEQVKAIFELYVETPSLVKVAQELNRRGWRRKSWTTKTGTFRQGGEWDGGSLRRLLIDPLYVGMQKLGDATFPGEHKAIVPKKLYETVQRLMAANRSDHGATARNRHGFLLRGLLRCAACDAAMVPHPTKKNGKRYRYYTCRRAQKQGRAACPTGSISADKIEAFVVDRIRCIGANPDLQAETFRQSIGQLKAERLGLKREAKRLERDLVKARTNVEKLVTTLTTAEGSARDAINIELEKGQEHVRTLETRLVEVRSQQADIDAAQIDEADLARALEAFDPIWDVLLTPEKERVLNLLIDRISYDGHTEELKIEFRMEGVATLAAELEPGGSS